MNTFINYIFRLTFLFFFLFNYSQTINWMSLEKAIELQKNNPKNILVDVYTNWCGPCKLMDKNTFQNKEIALFINDHYYAVKFNGEGNEIVNFMGRQFENKGYDESKSQTRNSSHQFTQFLGVNAYPTTLFFDKKMNLITPIRGYLRPKQIEIYLQLFKDDSYKKVKTQEDFDTFFKNFKSKFNN
ncbi:MAG: thioredoxin family protein [Flavobacteriales bacterium]|jgi:thioredoxin-related protein